MGLRQRLGLDWLSEQLAPVVNISGRVHLDRRTEGDITILNDGRHQIAVLPSHDGRALRHGVHRRMQRLARSYGVGSLIKLKPGDVVVNCGANIGTLTVAFAQRGARVIAIEPDPTTLVPLRWNTRVYHNVEVVPVGLWNEDGELTFYQAPDSSDTSAINPDGPPISIMANKLDTLIAQRDITNVKLLIGDAEGAEPEVIEGATETLKITEYFSMECGYERRGERTVEKCTDLLKERGFKVLRVTKRNRLIARRMSA